MTFTSSKEIESLMDTLPEKVQKEYKRFKRVVNV